MLLSNVNSVLTLVINVIIVTVISITIIVIILKEEIQMLFL